MNKKGRIMWGLSFIAIAVLIVLFKLGMLEMVGIGSLIISVLMLPMIIMNIIHMNFGGFLFPMAVIAILYAKPLGISALSPWPILLVALFLSLGLSSLFPRHYMRRHCSDGDYEKIIDSPDESEINLSTKFGGSIKYVNTKNFKRMNIDCSCAGLKVYFDNAEMAEDTATVDVNMNLAGIEMYIPKNWDIQSDVNYMMGGTEIKGKCAAITDKTIVVTGNASLAGITIIYE